MSFSSEVKKELCRVNVKLKEVELAEVYGFLLFCRRFTPDEIYFRTESGCAAQRFCQLVSSVSSAVTEVDQTLTARKGSAVIYKALVPDSSDCERIFTMFGHERNDVSLRINQSVIEFEPCAAAFLRGAFLTCGSITAPETEYRIEFNMVHKNLSEDLCRVIKETTLLAGGRAASPKISCRRGAYVVYLKESDDVADLLTLMGAGNASMAVMQVKIEKSIENTMNRRINSQIANTDKTVSAAAKQVKAINALMRGGILQTLSEELRAAANLRLEHPIASLKELSQASDPPVSKSGLNHRLKKLVELAAELDL